MNSVLRTGKWKKKFLGEFFCKRSSDNEDDWKENNICTTDLRLRVLDSNLVMFDFIENDIILDSYRLCWNGFIGFIDHFQEWFFDDENDSLVPSCIDENNNIQCILHNDLVVSMAIGKDQPEHVFYANRSDVLKLFDDAMRLVMDQPEIGCYHHTASENESFAQNLEEQLDKLVKGKYLN